MGEALGREIVNPPTFPKNIKLRGKNLKPLSVLSAKPRGILEGGGVRNRLRLSRALVVALYGTLGAGKTMFVKGFAKGAGARGKITSPTFLIMRRFPLRKNRRGFKNLFHVDAYRIKSHRELAHIDFHKILADPKNIVIVEWPSKVSGSLSNPFITITLRHRRKENERGVIFLVQKTKKSRR